MNIHLIKEFKIQPKWHLVERENQSRDSEFFCPYSKNAIENNYSRFADIIYPHGIYMIKGRVEDLEDGLTNATTILNSDKGHIKICSDFRRTMDAISIGNLTYTQINRSTEFSVIGFFKKTGLNIVFYPLLLTDDEYYN